MNSDTVLRSVFVLLAVAALAIRVVYHLRAKTYRRSFFNIEKEGLAWVVARNILGISFLVCMVLYIVLPRSLAWADLSMSPGLRWCGAVLGAVSLLLIVWIHQALGTSFSGTLHVKDDHVLVTDGPYRWVRHPMYTAILIQFVGFFLLSANGLLGTLGISAIVSIMLGRTAREEQMMVKAFPADYPPYAERTGRFFPRPFRRLPR